MPLIPLTAASMTMPALFRTVSGQAEFPKKRWWWIAGVMFSAASFVGWMALLVPPFGIIGTPVAAILAFGIPCVTLFVKNQRGPNPFLFPYRSIAIAALCGAAVAVFFHFVHFSGRWLQLAEITALMLLYIASFFFLRVIPKAHRQPLLHIAKTALRRKPHGFDRQQGLSALGRNQLRLLEDAIVNKIPVEVFTGGEDGTDGNGAEPRADGPSLAVPRLPRRRREAGPASKVPPERLVKILRKAGEEGGIPVGEATEYDERVAKFLFADVPTAARNATMKTLVASGADSNDLRALEDLVAYLAHTPKQEWAGNGKRRRAAGLSPRA